MMGPRAFLLHRDTAAVARLYRVHTRSTLRSATSPPTNLWAVRREWLRSARSDTNPTHLPPSVVAHRATTLTTFVAVSVRKIHLHPAGMWRGGGVSDAHRKRLALRFHSVLRMFDM
jgi:hypothetical protein